MKKALLIFLLILPGCAAQMQTRPETKKIPLKTDVKVDEKLDQTIDKLNADLKRTNDDIQVMQMTVKEINEIRDEPFQPCNPPERLKDQ